MKQIKRFVISFMSACAAMVAAVTASAESPSLLDLASSDVAGSSAMNGENSTLGRWSDGSKAAVKGKAYRVEGKTLRTPDTDSSAWTGGYTFAGDCLQLAEGALLLTKNRYGNKLTIPTLRVTGSAVVSHGSTTAMRPLTAVAELSGGNWLVEAGGTLHLRCRQTNVAESDTAHYATPTYLVTAAISGTGTIKTGTDEGQYQDNPGVVEFAGDNRAFTGKLLMIANVPLVTKFDTAASWFGNPAEPVADGVTLAAKMKLVFGATLSTGANRGFVCEGATSEISVEAGQTVTVDGPFAAQNGFTKTGAGTLVISGDSSNLDWTKIVVQGGAVKRRPVVAVVTDYVGFADGASHSATVTVTTPSDGYAVSWEPAVHEYSEAGTYTNTVTVTADGYDPFVADCVVRLVGFADLYLKESDVAGSSAMNGEGSTPGQWSDGSKAAVKGKAYRVEGKTLRTPDTDSSAWTGGYTFAGDCLQLADGATLGTKNCGGDVLTIPYLQVTGLAKVRHLISNKTAVSCLTGTLWQVESGATLWLSAYQGESFESNTANYGPRTYLVTAPIRGTGTIKTGTDECAYADNPGVVEFAGDNGAFTGKLLTIANVPLVTKFDTAESWFGNPAEPVADGVTLAAKMKLVFGATLSTGANRGFVCEGATSEIRVEANQTVTVDGPFAAQNGFTKTGAGTLVISGETGVDPARVKITGGVVRIGGTDYFPPALAVKERLCDELIRELGGAQAILEAAAAVPALPASGRWDDIDYASHANSNWSPRFHFERCQALAAAIYLGAPQADDYAAIIVRAMEAWYADVPTSVNWWQQIINIPQMAGRIALLAEGKIADEAVFGSIVDNVATDYGDPSVQTGANLLRVSGIRFMHGVLVRDEEEMEFQAARIKNEVKVVPFGQEGIVDDWCFHQHGSQPQINNYGLEYLQGNVTWIRVFDGESYAYPQAKIDILMNMATNCFAWSVWRGVMSPDTMGRQLYRSMAGDGAEMTNAIGLLVGEVPEPVGYHYFPRSAYAVNRSTNWMATVKMGTAQIISTESGNHENLKGKFVGDGAIYTMVTGLEYNDVYPLWDDWRMAPGVTQMRGVSVDWPNPPDVGGNFRRPTATVSNSDANKTTTFTYGPEEGLSYAKSWTFRENGYDVRVWNIAVTAQAPSARTDVATCVENANAAEDAGLVTQNADYSVYRNGEVYYIVWAAPEQISFVLEDRTGDVGDYTTYYPREVSGRLFQIVVSHGRNPSNAALSYAVRIGGWNEKDGKLQTVVYVDKNASPDNRPPYDSPENAVDSIERGAASVAFGGKVILAPNQTWGLDGTLSLAGSFSLVGPSDRSTVITGAGVTVNANQAFENLTFVNDVVTVNAGGVVSNCVVRGGSGVGYEGRALVMNGGLAVDTTIENFKGNGVWMEQNMVSTLERCVIRNGDGAVVKANIHYSSIAVLPSATAVLRDCVVTNNITRCSMSGGILGYAYAQGVSSWRTNYDYDLILDRCVVANNQGRAGAMRLCNQGALKKSDPNPYVYATNCLFTCNKSVAVEGSGATATFWGRGEFVNCTIAGNSPAGKVFHLANQDAATCPANAEVCKLVNTIISDNGDVPTYDSTYGPITARNSVFREAEAATYAGKGNLVGPAVFRGTGKTPYALKENSPGYGTGDASIWTLKDVDLVGKRRLNSKNSVDMGCYRSHPVFGLVISFR